CRCRPADERSSRTRCAIVGLPTSTRAEVMSELHRDDDIHEIRLARPPVNALDPGLLTTLREAVEAAPGQGARGLVIAGGPTVFSGGMDVPHLLTLDREALTAAWWGFFQTARAIA